MHESAVSCKRASLARWLTPEGDARCAGVQQIRRRCRLTVKAGGTLLAILPTFGMRWLVWDLHPEVTINAQGSALPRNRLTQRYISVADWPGTGDCG